MTNLVMAVAQQQMRLFDSQAAYGKELSRFLHMARAKGAGLVVFPALSGVMAATPLVEGLRVNLLKQADVQRRQGSLWARTRGALAGGTAGLLGASFRKAFSGLLRADGAGVQAAYEATFGDLAKAYEVTIIGGSAYLLDVSGVLRHRATVFGPDGAVLGYHDKIVLSPEDQDLAVAGDTWSPISTPVGTIGILLGEEALYPEASRVLARAGADLLVTLAAVGNETLAAYLRAATIARAQENQCFAVSSFLVGRNHLAPEVGHGDSSAPAELAGKSGIYAPLELTPRYSGVLVEVGTTSSEGLITAALDRVCLSELGQGDVARALAAWPVELFGQYLSTPEPAAPLQGTSVRDEAALSSAAEIVSQ